MTKKTTTKPAYITNLQDKLEIKNINAVPKIEKVIVSMGIGSLVTRKGLKDFWEFEKNLLKITGQKACISKSKKAISNFKLREDQPVMLRVTLRKGKALDFLYRFMKVVLPRIRDFAWASTKSFDKQFNFNMWVKNYNIFPELWVEDVTIPMWIGITVVTSARSIEEGKAILEEIWLVFK